MNCPRCGAQNPDSAAKCTVCGISLALGGDAETFAGIVPAPIPASTGKTPPPKPVDQSPSLADMATAGPWAMGTGGAGGAGEEVNFGPRYKIQRMLGEGGMGAVYKAYDTELDRTVALKLIRPGLAMDQNVAARFKQELLLASKVSHKNILRIHDLGDANGVKFISMAFVEGHDLHQLLVDNGKLPIERALKITRQLCAALDAAHAEGVVHRDFKPQNILLDKNEQVYVTDFGLAKSLETDMGLSRSGEFLGTPRYMAPEQVEGRGIDHRVDIYSMGLILYEMLTGDVPFHADSTIQLMYKRVNETPKSPRDLNPELPEWLSRVVLKCLARNPDERYQNAVDVLHDIDNASAPPKSGSRRVQITLPQQVSIPGGKITLAVAAVIVVAAIALAIPAVRQRIFRSGTRVATPSKPISVLVADFTNHTGDPVFDSTLEPMMNVALEGASFINAYNRGTARKLAQKLPNPTDKLDEQPARLVALGQGISAVVTGEISRRGDNYSVSAVALDAASGNVIAQSEVTASNKDEVLRVIPKLAAPIRNALGDATPESAQLVSAGGAFTAASLEVVHQYGIAMEQQFAGKVEEALQSFQKAAELDPNFARAYSGMTSAALKLNRLEEADRYITSAMAHVDRMTDRERYRVRGFYYLTTLNWKKCTEEYSELVSRYPGDNIAHNNLAVCYSNLRNLPKAVEEAQLDLKIKSSSSAAANLSLFSTYGGDFAAGEAQAQQVQQTYPTFEYGYLAQAFAQMGQGRFADATSTYDKLKALGPFGASMATAGLADIAVYQGGFADAARMLEKGAADDLAAKSTDDAADKFCALAYTELARGRKSAAVAAAEKALATGQAVKVRFLAGLVLAEAGEAGKAEQLAAKLGAELQAEPQADAKIITAMIQLKRGQAREAVQNLTEANTLLDTWIGHFQLARAYLAAGAFTEADSELDRCVRRRGEALSLFLDQVPTFGFFPSVYYYQGRVREGLKSPGFAEPYRAYLAIRGRSADDPLVAEIRRRIGN